METLGDAMKKEYAKMSTADLKGVIAQGQNGMEDYLRGVAPSDCSEEIIKETAQMKISDISQELEKRGE